jgi:DNA-binding winged helix-turn-helix (wHTH) protein/tetratricopeptide (TPR) repeat protein
MTFARQELEAGFRIGEYLIQPRQNRVVRGDAEVRLERRVVDVLVCLAEHAGEVVSRETLHQRVWGNVVVTDQAMTNCISELRHHLGDDRVSHRIIETIPKRGYRLTAPVQLAAAKPAPEQSPPSTRTSKVRQWRVLAGGLLLLAAAVGATVWWRNASEPTLTTVVVLQFENAANDAALDYLSLALPDEVATLLTKSRDLGVRPLDYIAGDDPLSAARARRVDHVVSGRFYRESNNQLTLAIEAQHVLQERVIWRTRVTAPDLLAMRGRITETVQAGLLPALGASPAASSGSTPEHGEAYQLYLHSLALPKQPKPTERAIEMLERAVALEPRFAPAWHALGVRYYDHGSYGAGGEPARQQALVAHRRALELDPGMIGAARRLVNHRVEAGELEAAYREARQLFQRYGPGVETHFALAYVYRFGGLMDDAQRECELALEFDPHDPRLRSCAYSYLYAGKPSRGMRFLALDEGSYFFQWGSVLFALRQDDRSGALQIARQAHDEPTRRLMEPCLAGASPASLDRQAEEFVTFWKRQGDPENYYSVATMLVYCGRSREALHLVELAVAGNYCAYPALDLDTIWGGLRKDPGFQRVRSQAMNCHARFRKSVDEYGANP